MLCKTIMEVIERTYPKQAAMEWDNVGLLVGRTEKEVRKIFVALDVTDEVIEHAIEKGADMLITHHPLIFTPMKQITDEQFIGKRIVKLLQHDISYYAMHTNYDVLGMADLTADLLKLKDTEVFEITQEEPQAGIGKIGSFSKDMTVGECCEWVKERFGLETVKLFGDATKQIQRVAVSPGSGKHMTGLAIEKHADVLITGDIDHHEGIDAVAQGLTVIDAGHYGLEYVFINDIASYLRKNLDGIVVEQEEVSQPFQVI